VGVAFAGMKLRGRCSDVPRDCENPIRWLRDREWSIEQIAVAIRATGRTVQNLERMRSTPASATRDALARFIGWPPEAVAELWQRKRKKSTIGTTMNDPEEQRRRRWRQS